MKVKFKNLGKAVLPKYANPGDAGMDVVATSKTYDEFGNVVYGTDLAMEIPEGFVCLIFPRSSNSKKDLLMSNSVGVLDSGYRGELTFKFKPSGVFVPVYHDNVPSEPVLHWAVSDAITYEIGERIGQLIIIPYPAIEPEWADVLSDTVRGSNGWGSTGQ